VRSLHQKRSSLLPLHLGYRQNPTQHQQSSRLLNQRQQAPLSRPLPRRRAPSWICHHIQAPCRSQLLIVLTLPQPRKIVLVRSDKASSEGLRTYSPTITITTTTARTLPRNEVTHEPSLFPSFAFLAFTRFHTTSFLSIPISLRKQLILLLRLSAYFPIHCSVNIISKCCTYLLFHE